jgi:tRNA (guanine-N7-)-methyltransferase
MTHGMGTPDQHPADAAPDSAETHAELRSFGRRRGRKLSDRQAQLLAEASFLDLSRPAPQPLTQVFPATAAIDDVWIEIGFGGAEHLLWQAEHHPHVGCIGCEPFEDGVVKALTGIAAKGLGNVCLHPDDVRPVLRWLPAAAIGRAFILFPDPWPKRKHRKRRLVNAATLAMLADAMRPGAELRIGTDIADYARTILEAFIVEPRFVWQAESPADWRVRPADWPPTRYEAKAKAAGRVCYYFRFSRR